MEVMDLIFWLLLCDPAGLGSARAGMEAADWGGCQLE